MAALLAVVGDTGFALWALRDPYDGGNVGGGAALIPLLLGGLPWSLSYMAWPAFDEDSLAQNLYPLVLGAMVAFNLAIAWCCLDWLEQRQRHR